ncbi:hypothetical protein [Natrialba chahannaoensis]|uniref:hypothetical protein n=1 Tax=Natrialba chahannaoensis TaxID=68911 RepID=UPI0012693DD0|nr:hypothetical protein [Natrialba chahannaoensis]
MDGTIYGEDDLVTGVTIVDNNRIEHDIQVERNGDIYSHQQDTYPDKGSERTDEENVHVAQSRRFARYHVYRERGHPTLEPWQTPEGPAVVAASIADLPTETFEHHFGTYYQQFRSTIDADSHPVIDPPEADGLTAYLQYVYLDIDLESLLGQQVVRSLAAVLEASHDRAKVTQAIREALEQSGVNAESFTIADVSDLGVLYQTRTGDEKRDPRRSDMGAPDARLELSPIDAPWEAYLPVEGFQMLVVHHLLCQTRDCYLQMGLEPPESVKILGTGTFRQTVRNEHLEQYEPVHYTDSSVDSYRLPDLSALER